MYESIYPWERWSNGQAWRVTQGAGHEFTCQGASFVAQVHKAALRLNLAAAASLFVYEYDDDVVFFWFYDRESLWKPNFKAFPAWREEQRRHARRTRRPA